MSSEKTPHCEIFLRAFKKAKEITKLNQTAIAVKLGVRASSINTYATGKKEPGLGVVTRIAAAFGYDIVDFLALGREVDPFSVASLVQGQGGVPTWSGAPATPAAEPAPASGPMVPVMKYVEVLEENRALRAQLDAFRQEGAGAGATVAASALTRKTDAA